MKPGSTTLLRVAVVILGLVVLALCISVLPAGITHNNVGGYLPVLLGMYATATPFFFALYQAWKLLGYIDKSHAFSKQSIKALTRIKYCAVAISTAYAAAMPYIYFVAKQDDAPGVVLIGLIIVFASMVIAVFAALLQRLLRSALEIKAENDLTV